MKWCLPNLTFRFVRKSGLGDQSGYGYTNLNQALAGGVDRRLGAVGGAGLVEYVADVTAHGPGADE